MAYREKLERLIYDDALRGAMGRAGLLEARQRSWSEAMKKLLDGYEEVLVGTRPLAAA